MNLNVKRAFTLVELMLVIALMGVMGTLAVGAYSAVTRGMSERAALAAARSFAEVALQRAQIDRTRTFIYLFNEVTRLDSDTAAGLAQGLAVAVRPCGRVTMVDGDKICDEFGDLNRSFKSLDADEGDASAGEEQASASVMRIYNISAQSYADVEEGFYSATVQDKDLATCSAANPSERSLSWEVYGFKKVSGADFKVGDAYGQEFAVTRLPPGYVFSSSVNLGSTSDLGQKQVTVIAINPDDTATPSFQVYARRPDGTFESIGSTSSTKDAAQQ